MRRIFIPYNLLRSSSDLCILLYQREFEIRITIAVIGTPSEIFYGKSLVPLQEGQS